jgi:hypothetical protein
MPGRGGPGRFAGQVDMKPALLLRRPAFRRRGAAAAEGAPEPVPVRSPRQAPAWRLAGVLLLLVAALLGLRTAHHLRPVPEVARFPSGPLVLVGIAGRYEPDAVDRALLDTHSRVQAAVVSVRPRYVGDCAAAGWATLGAGRRTSVTGLCNPAVQGGRVTDWSSRLAAAAAAHGDARLGTLAESVPGCVAAVGPGAALAAARPDGSLARYDTVEQFLSGGLVTPCPITLVDGGPHSDEIVRSLAGRPGVNLVVAGIGPPPGTRDPRPQLVYALGAIPNGWLTSASTRRDGIITLADLTATLVGHGRGGEVTTALPLDGTPVQVVPGRVTAVAAQEHLDAVDALSYAVLRGDLALGVGGAVLGALYLVSLRRGWGRPARVVAACGCILPAAMMLTGAVPWWNSSRPGLALSLLVTGWAVLLSVLTLVAARRLRVPIAAVGAAVTVAAFTVDAALGAVMEPGSMLNSRPVNGGRWYGFGNVTFAVYAAAALVLLGYVAHRFRTAGRARAALTAVAALGTIVVVCEGWPSMGADFGGVLVLTPVLLGLLLVWSGLPITAGRVVGAAGAAAVAAAVVSWLDWRRGPAARSHLGAFVQRLLDGDAQDIVIRKAVAAGESILTPAGIGSLVAGAIVWVLLFHRLLPALADGFSTLRTTAVAALAAAVLGTLLNDGGVSVWYTLTAAFAISVAALATEQAYDRTPAAEPRSIPAPARGK